MKCISMVVAALCLVLASTASAQTSCEEIRGGGTPNSIPMFTGMCKVGNSPIVQFNGNIGIDSPDGQPTARLEVSDFRNFDANGHGPNAIFGVVTCQVPFVGCAAIRGDANEVSVGAIGVVGNQFSPSGGGGGVDGQTFGYTSFTYGTRGESFATSGVGVGLMGITWSPQGDGGRFVGVGGAPGTIIRGHVGPPGAGTEFTVFRVDGTGRVFADGGFQPSGADFAESMAVTGDRSKYEAGDLLVIDPSANRHLAQSHEPYSALVAGIYSTKPGMLGSPRRVSEPEAKDEVPLAVVGIVPCRVTAENGAIRAGDLLVTSSTAGHAMKGTDRSKMLGAVVGKALEPLAEGKGVIQVLVTLQ